MKKLLIILMSLISFSLFATNPVTDYVHVKGYYEEEESSLIFKVWRQNELEDIGRVYHAGDIYLDGDPTTREERIFTWELSGNKNLTVNLTFTITPLQAYSNGTYHIPKHTLKMYSGNNTKTHEFSTATSGSTSYPEYRQGSSGSSSFIIKSAVFKYTNESITTQTPKTGYCTLRVLEYDEDTAGNFDYVSYVTVEFDTV